MGIAPYCRWQVANEIVPKFHLTDVKLVAYQLESMAEDFVQSQEKAIEKTITTMWAEVKNALSDMETTLNEEHPRDEHPKKNRRLVEELPSSDLDHAKKLLPRLHRQLEEVQSRLRQVTHDDNLALVKERLLFDVHRRLEAHLAERQLSSSDAPPFC